MSSIQNNYLMSALFGNKNTANNGSIFSASNLMDLSLMKNGAYTRMLRSYYEKTDTSDTTKKKTTSSNSSDYASKVSEAFSTSISGVSSSVSKMSDVKGDASNLVKSSEKVASLNVDKATDDELYSAVSGMVKDVNSLIKSTSDSGNSGVVQIEKWMKNDISLKSNDLSKIGISVGKDGKMTLDKDVFSSADKSDIKSVLTGDDGLASKIETRAAGLEKYAANRIFYESGTSLYTNTGLLG